MDGWNPDDDIGRFANSGIVGIDCYDGGVIVVKRVGPGSPGGCGSRGDITHLSSRARANMLFVVSTTKVKFNSMMTLTYGKSYPGDGKEVKCDLRRFLTRLRRAYGKPSYLWFLEFQKRGAPHFHILVDLVPRSAQDNVWLGENWAKCMGKWSELPLEERRRVVAVHSHPKQWEAIREQQGALKYVAKYTLKTKQKSVPKKYGNVGRFWGCNKAVKSVRQDSASWLMDDKMLRALLAEEGHQTANWDMIPKHVFGSQLGEILGAVK